MGRKLYSFHPQKYRQGGLTNGQVFWQCGGLFPVACYSLFHSGRTVSVGQQERELIQLVP